MLGKANASGDEANTVEVGSSSQVHYQNSWLFAQWNTCIAHRTATTASVSSRSLKPDAAHRRVAGGKEFASSVVAPFRQCALRPRRAAARDGPRPPDAVGVVSASARGALPADPRAPRRPPGRLGRSPRRPRGDAARRDVRAPLREGGDGEDAGGHRRAPPRARRARAERTAAWCGRGASPRSPSSWATRVAFDAADLERVERETKRRSGRTLDARALAPAWAALLKRDFPTSATNANANPNPPPGDDESRPHENHRRAEDDPLDDARATYLARAAIERGRVASARAALARAYADERDAKRRAAARASTSRPRRSDERRASRRVSRRVLRTREHADAAGGSRSAAVPSAPRGSGLLQSGVGSSSRDRLASRLGMGAGPAGAGIRAAVEARVVGGSTVRPGRRPAAVRGWARRRRRGAAAAARARNRPAARVVEEAEL